MNQDPQQWHKRPFLPAIEALPDAFFGEKESLLDDNESADWLGDRILPPDVSFLEMTLLDCR